MLTLIVLIAALVCFLLAAFGLPRARVHFGWLGAALFTVASIITAWPGATA